MKGFKYLLQAAEAGDRSSMITVARGFDTGINLPAGRLVRVILKQSTCLSMKALIGSMSAELMIILPPGGILAVLLKTDISWFLSFNHPESRTGMKRFTGMTVC